MSAHEDAAAWSRRLLRAWAILAALTVLSVAAALLGGGGGRSSLVAVVIALAASYVKARQVLDHFLDLRRAGPGWRHFFSATLLVLLGICLGLYGVALI